MFDDIPQGETTPEEEPVVVEDSPPGVEPEAQNPMDWDSDHLMSSNPIAEEHVVSPSQEPDIQDYGHASMPQEDGPCPLREPHDEPLQGMSPEAGRMLATRVCLLQLVGQAQSTLNA